MFKKSLTGKKTAKTHRHEFNTIFTRNSPGRVPGLVTGDVVLLWQV
jgi:hypothetical protein